MSMLPGKITLLATLTSSLRQAPITVRAFGTLINLSNNAGSSQNPQIATSDNNVYVTWNDNTDNTPAGNNDIFYSTNNQAFSTFGSPINISNNPGESQFPEIAVSG